MQNDIENLILLEIIFKEQPFGYQRTHIRYIKLSISHHRRGDGNTDSRFENPS